MMDTVSDRRLKPRINCDYPAVVRGQDALGVKFEDHTTLSNLSRSGLYLRLNRALSQGDRVSVTITLTHPFQAPEPHRLAASGIVVRTEPHPDGGFGLAIQIQHYRFL